MHKSVVLVLAIFLHITAAFSDTVTRKEQLSSRRHGVGGIQVLDQFYFAGGFEFNDYVASNITEIYNITSSQWAEPIHLNVPRAWISTAVIGHYIYFIGGARYEGDCAMLYSTINHQYESIGCGPTVRQAIQVSHHNSTVTVLGSYSADFYDDSNGWYHIPKLTSWMQSIEGGLTVVHENLIIGISGVNTTTLQPLYAAWIYNTSNDEVIKFEEATKTVNFAMNSTVDFRVQNGKIIIFTADTYFAHEFGTTKWFEEKIIDPYEAVALSDVAFIFNASGYIVYNWSNGTTKWITLVNITHIGAFQNSVVMVDSYSRLRIYSNGDVQQKGLLSGISIAVKVGTSFLVYNGNNFQMYDTQSQLLTLSTITFPNASSIVPLDDTTVILFNNTGATAIFTYNQALLVELTVQTNGMQEAFTIGDDIISLKSSQVLVSLATVKPIQLPQAKSLISKDGSAITLVTSIKDYPYIEVYDYLNKEWQNTTIFINIAEEFSVGESFATVAVIDDMLIVMKNSATFRYNTTSGESFQSLTVPAVESFSTVCSVKVVNGVGNLPGTLPETIITVNSETASVSTKQETGAKTYQYVTTNDNVIYMAARAGSFERIFTYDVNTDTFQSFFLPIKQDQLSIGVSNDSLLALGSNGFAYAVSFSDYSRWFQIELARNTAPNIAVYLDNGLVMVAGGKHFQYQFYTDEILFVNVSALIDLGVEVYAPTPLTNAPISVLNTITTNGLTVGELVAAIVVPVVVAIAGLILLIVLLLRKRRRDKKKGFTNTAGLEARYGAWFTPFDQITFGEQLGQGGSGQVFKGKWKNTSVALKVSMTQANNSVITELELMMQLRPHPNVVQLFGFSVHPETNSIILIIEFCEGGSIDTKLYDNGDEISLQTQVQWLTGIAKGLSHLHSNNIVHRDVAARNVLLNRNEPKLTDFGMSRLVDDQQQHGTTKSELGPIRWMSPESLKNKEYSTKSDIWSFGILMFEVIARQEPHSEADPIEVGRLIRDEGLTPVIPSSCHPKFSDVMKQCWQMSPQSRPTIERVIESLEAIQMKSLNKTAM